MSGVINVPKGAPKSSGGGKGGGKGKFSVGKKFPMSDFKPLEKAFKMRRNVNAK